VVVDPAMGAWTMGKDTPSKSDRRGSNMGRPPAAFA
jgi:hypothetical protein